MQTKVIKDKLLTTDKRVIVFLLLFLMWLFLAFFSLLINLDKTVTVEKNWLFLSNNEKRYKLFGSLYSFFEVINHTTPSHTQILIFSKDVRTFYLGVYYLYPRLITSTDSLSKLNDLANKENYLYIATYNSVLHSHNYKQIVTFFDASSHNYGRLYKKL